MHVTVVLPSLWQSPEPVHAHEIGFPPQGRDAEQPCVAETSAKENEMPAAMTKPPRMFRTIVDDTFIVASNRTDRLWLRRVAAGPESEIGLRDARSFCTR